MTDAAPLGRGKSEKSSAVKWLKKWSRRGRSPPSSDFSGLPGRWLCQHSSSICFCTHRTTTVDSCSLRDRQAHSQCAYFLVPAIVSSLRCYLPPRILSSGFLVVWRVNPPQKLKAKKKKKSTACQKIFLSRIASISWNVFAFPSLYIFVTRLPECLYQVLISLWSTLKYPYVTIPVTYEFNVFLTLFFNRFPCNSRTGQGRDLKEPLRREVQPENMPDRWV